MRKHNRKFSLRFTRPRDPTTGEVDRSNFVQGMAHRVANSKRSQFSVNSLLNALLCRGAIIHFQPKGN